MTLLSFSLDPVKLGIQNIVIFYYVIDCFIHFLFLANKVYNTNHRLCFRLIIRPTSLYIAYNAKRISLFAARG